MHIKPYPTLQTVMKSGNALAFFTMPYMALAYALKLDGYVSLSWTVLLAPVWLPLAAYVALFVLCLVLLFLCWGIRAAGGAFKS